MLRSQGFLLVAVPLLLLGGVGTHAQTYDILLQGGYVVDPLNGIDGNRDVAIANGRVGCCGAIDRCSSGTSGS